MKISLFKNSFASVPDKDITIEDFLDKIKSGYWKKQVEKFRETKNKKVKSGLPAVTVSGSFKTRDKNADVKKKIRQHSGLICLDIDRKDNPKMSTAYAIDNECLAQFVSCSGEGLKIIYRCTPTNDPTVHWRIYDAVEKRLKSKNFVLKVDSQVKSISSLQYVTFDPEPYINLKTKLVIKPDKPKKIKKFKTAKSGKPNDELDTLNELIKDLGKKDITTNYEDWSNIAFGLSYSLGEVGREVFHKLSKNYSGYSAHETDEKYDYHLDRNSTAVISKPITLATVYDLITAAVGKGKLKQLNKQKGKAIGVGEEVEDGDIDLAGMVRYKLFLFKKMYDKETKEAVALVPNTINLIEFGKLLQAKGFLRYEREFVHIVDNIVDKVDTHTILYQISEYIIADGDYEFTYKGEVYKFSWEDLLHLWKTIKGRSSTHYTIPSDLKFWEPNLLKDTTTISYIPFQNGVLHVTGKKRELIPYKKLTMQIWKELILPRDFKYNSKRGMFEDFFINVTGRGSKKARSDEFRRGLWYFGYMLQGTKDPATARAWMLYDVNVGNNGRSGKSIIGQALGKIRFVTTIDGKQVDFENRFWLQSVKPWTNIIFIDDPSFKMSLTSIFNMISGTVVADRKMLSPLEIQPKFLIASNHIMESDGVSESDRQFVTQLDDFYVRYGKTHGDSIMPIVLYHKKRFFTEWNEKDWAMFDTFAVKSLQYYYANKPPGNTIIGDSKLIRFKQSHGEELFHDLTEFFRKNFDRQTGTISRDQIIGIIKDSDNTTNSKKAGSTARYFINCINGGKPEITTKGINGRAVNVYKLHVKWEAINLGPQLKQLKK